MDKFLTLHRTATRQGAPMIRRGLPNNTYFENEVAAIAKLDQALWPDGPVCPHCGGRRVARVHSRRARVGLRRCLQCRKEFRVTVGTTLARSHVPADKWLLALVTLLYVDSMNAHRLHQVIWVSHKTALRITKVIKQAIMTDPKVGTFEDAIRIVAKS